MTSPTVFLSLTGAVPAASAASEFSSEAGFTAGFMHLASEPDHLLAVIALALLSLAADRRTRLAMLAATAAGLAAGALSGALVPPLEQAETANLASIAVLGALVATGVPVPRSGGPLVAFLAFVGHGYANVLDLGGRTPPYDFIAGIIFAAMCVMAPSAVTNVTMGAQWQQIMVRAVGSWISAIGLMVLAVHVTSP